MYAQVHSIWEFVLPRQNKVWLFQISHITPSFFLYLNIAKGQTLSYYKVPNRRVGGFVGWEDILQKINEALSDGAGPHYAVLQGIGGQGKSQVALEYCRRKKNNKESLSVDEKKIVEKLGCHPIAVTQAAAYIRKWKPRLCNFMDVRSGGER